MKRTVTEHTRSFRNVRPHKTLEIHVELPSTEIWRIK